MVHQLVPTQDADDVLSKSLTIDAQYVKNVLSVQGIKDLFNVTEKVEGKFLVDVSLLKDYYTDGGFKVLKKLLKKKVSPMIGLALLAINPAVVIKLSGEVA